MTLPHFKTLIAAAFGDDSYRDDLVETRRRMGEKKESPLPNARILLDPAEEELLLGQLRGDNEGVARAAFERVYGAYAATVWRFVVRLTSSAAEAEEIVHDVFAHVWTNRTHWSPVGGVAAYLFRAARNRAIDASRHAAVVARIGGETMCSPPGMGVAPSAPDVGPLQEELRRAVRAAVSALPERRRTALMLRYLRGMSYAQIATVLGTTEKAAFILVARTREALRPVLQKFSQNNP